MPSSDGKSYKTDVADTEQLFRLIQSIPSPKAEPFKLWMAQVAKERLDEHVDVAKQGGTIALNARLDLERKIGKSVVTPLNAKDTLGL